MDIEFLHQHCLLTALSDVRMKQHLQTLNRTFTTGREQLVHYATDPALVSAYAAFYLPTNYQKLKFVLGQLDVPLVEAGTPFEVVDFGCGPGTYSFAMYDHYGSGTYHLVDRAEIMRSQARRIQQTLYPRMKATISASVPARSDGGFRVVLCGNVVNETGITTFSSLLERFNADAYVFIEPGTRASFDNMRQVRELLVNGGYHLAYPCASDEPCPLVGNNVDDWCHQSLKVSLHPRVARLGQLASLDRTVMPFIGHVYTRQPNAPGPPLLFRTRTQSKHAFFWEICAQRDEALVLCPVELPKKPFSKQEQKQLAAVSAGQRFTFIKVKSLGSGTLRIAQPNFR